MQTLEKKQTSRKTNDDCYRRGLEDGRRRCLDAIQAKELEYHRLAAGATLEGKADDALQYAQTASILSAVVLTIDGLDA